jgi:ketosteroid isomerase-like protein
MTTCGRPGWAVAALLLAVLTAGCATTQAPDAHGAAANDDLKAVIEAYYDAINRRDLGVLTAYVTPDVEWYSLVGGERILEVESREGLKDAFETYFGRFTETRATIESAWVVGQLVAVRERTQWSDGTLRGTGERLGVYELASGRIARITYFLPASP